MQFLVAFDGSDGALRALRESAPIASAAGAAITVMQVLDPRVDARDVTAETTIEAMKVVKQQTLEQIERAITAVGVDATARVEVVERGEDVGEAIARIANQEGVAAVAISTRRAAGLGGALLGSVTQQVIKHADCPVLVVNAD